MKNVTLRQLRIFEVVARHRSFSRASEELHLTQPAVSMQVQQLELMAGLPLTERIGKKVFLTPAGDEMARQARLIEGQIQAAQMAIAAMRGDSGGGALRIGVVSTAKYFAPRLLSQFSAQHSGVTLLLKESNREIIVRHLADNLIDLAIMGRPPHEFETIDNIFADHPLIVVCAQNHPFVGRRSISLADLADETWLIRELGSGTRSAMESYFSEMQFEPKVALELSSNETIKQAVMAGMGISFISAHCVALELGLGFLMQLPVHKTPVMRQWHVVHRVEKQLLPVALAFKSYLLKYGSETIALAASTIAQRRSKRKRSL